MTNDVRVPAVNAIFPPYKQRLLDHSRTTTRVALASIGASSLVESADARPMQTSAERTHNNP